MIGESPRHEKLTMGRGWVGPNGMVGPPWWRSEGDHRTHRSGTRVVHLDDLIDRGMVTPEWTDRFRTDGGTP